MLDETLKIMRHIFDARIDNAIDYSAYIAWTSARDIIEYALANNIECLKEFDYLPTIEDLMAESKRASSQPSNFIARPRFT